MLKVTIYSNDGNKRQTDCIFRNHGIFTRFISKYQNYGGFRRFNYGLWDDQYNPSHQELGSILSCNDEGFISIFRQLYTI